MFETIPNSILALVSLYLFVAASTITIKSKKNVQKKLYFYNKFILVTSICVLTESFFLCIWSVIYQYMKIGKYEYLNVYAHIIMTFGVCCWIQTVLWLRTQDLYKSLRIKSTILIWIGKFNLFLTIAFSLSILFCHINARGLYAHKRNVTFSKELIIVSTASFFGIIMSKIGFILLSVLILNKIRNNRIHLGLRHDKLKQICNRLKVCLIVFSCNDFCFLCLAAIPKSYLPFTKNTLLPFVASSNSLLNFLILNFSFENWRTRLIIIKFKSKSKQTQPAQVFAVA